MSETAILRQLSETLPDCIINARSGVVSKVTNWPFSEAPDGIHQALVALFDQVQHRNARGCVFLCDVHDLNKMGFD